jgi:hypothetical protein
MHYVSEMGSGAMIYMPSFVKIGPEFKRLWEVYTDKQTYSYRQEGDRISLL